MKKGIPRNCFASVRFPSSTCCLIRVELTSCPSIQTFSIIFTRKSSSLPIFCKSAAFPAPFAPKERSLPAAIRRTFICSTRIPETNSSGGIAAVSGVSGNSIRISTPMRSNRSLFSSPEVSSLPSVCPKKTEGGGSKVNTQALSPSFLHRSTSSRSLLWPI